jgi:hypothetical protein
MQHGLTWIIVLAAVSVASAQTQRLPSLPLPDLSGEYDLQFFGSGDRDIIGKWYAWTVAVSQDARGSVHGAMRDPRGPPGQQRPGSGTFTCTLQQHWNWFTCRGGRMRISWERHEYQTFEFDVKDSRGVITGIAEKLVPATAANYPDDVRYLRFEMRRR